MEIVIGLIAFVAGGAVAGFYFLKKNAQLQVDVQTWQTKFELSAASLENSKAEQERSQANLTLQFKDLAQKILDEKMAKFDQATSKSSDTSLKQLEGLLNPLKEKIKDFEKRVEDSYSTERLERNSLKSELNRLLELNQTMSKEAQNLTLALKGENKTQGNWGDVRTGDEAAASRYIEARLSKFALEVAFNNKTTEWQLSYDGRKNEPVTLPMKFPLLLAQGADGIAVGLSTKILPHNFCELIDASIKCLRGKKFELYPDFQTGGMIDVASYNDGKRGGKVSVRAHIEELDKKTLVIRDVPYSVTTTQLMESITKANDQGKIKIRKVTDVTAAEVEIQIDLAAGISPDITIDALYAFTDCEVSLSPNACVIVQDKPQFLTAHELLTVSSEHTKELLKKELEIRLSELEDKWHYTSLEKIFFEEKIYKELEQKHETWEKVIEAIDKAFNPFKKKLKRPIEREDIIKLTEKPVRRIYRLDINELNEQIKSIEAEIKQVNYDLEHLTDFAVAYFENLLKKFGKGRERKTEIKEFDT
ncbi:MAG: DNA recombination protein RmuC, partial [Bdellovibrionaceae bacterium]|nr:DNA recombination protein RmuC [Pseudobdellovibrionaceae bacterium]